MSISFFYHVHVKKCKPFCKDNYHVAIFKSRWGSNQEHLDIINSHLQNVCLEIIDFAFPE